MAEIDSSQGGGKKKGPKKVSTKIDMTPMVDLAFLLITFFMLTTTFNKASTMNVNMPNKDKDKPDQKMQVAEESTITLLLDKEDKIYYYSGSKKSQPSIERTNYSGSGIRKVIRDKRDVLLKNRDTLIVVIKIKDEAAYKNMVDILDEMAISNVRKYAIVDVAPEDIKLVKVYEEKLLGGGEATKKEEPKKN
jgi:biopolymer transport protein ExbD